MSSTNPSLVGSIVCALMSVSKEHLQLVLHVVNSLNAESLEQAAFAERLKSALPDRTLMKLLKATFVPRYGGVEFYPPFKEEVEAFRFESQPGFLNVDPIFRKYLGESIVVARDHDNKISLGLYLHLTQVLYGRHREIGDAKSMEGSVYSFTDHETLKYVLASILIQSKKGKQILGKENWMYIFRTISDLGRFDVAVSNGSEGWRVGLNVTHPN